MTGPIDLTDNPVRVLKAMFADQGLTVAPDQQARLDDLERYCEQPVRADDRPVRYIRDPEHPDLPPVKQELTEAGWRRDVEDD